MFMLLFLMLALGELEWSRGKKKKSKLRGTTQNGLNRLNRLAVPSKKETH